MAAGFPVPDVISQMEQKKDLSSPGPQSSEEMEIPRGPCTALAGGTMKTKSKEGNPWQEGPAGAESHGRPLGGDVSSSPAGAKAWHSRCRPERQRRNAPGKDRLNPLPGIRSLGTSMSAS
ncbi:serine/threonine-protein kinase 19 [Platysternon megacephalum]|uniref:Serine/threonine-protein kinase 19 n=1 Tax=Platysternon megacephalum TaxID=55544 RepID=A0A4D9DL52_9SAUR|nr:serine/threonine-protein kinase 19 [Platysternon megacephalum]